MGLGDISTGLGEWLKGDGPEADIVLSTRIRLARNLVEYPFLTTCSETQRSDIERFLQRRLGDLELGHNLVYTNLQGTEVLDRLCLVERHLISRDHAISEGDRGVAIDRDESISIMVNEEDHLRIQVLRSGFQCETAWNTMRKLEDTLQEVFNFSFSDEFGYLTACPSNVGTGMRVSVMLHLPALVLTKQIDKVFNAVSKMSLAVRGYYGEGTQASGDFYQISNQVTLGKSEDELIELISDVVPQIVKYERNIRSALMTDSRITVEDRVRRAYGMLREIRMITSEEIMDHLSTVRLGVNLGLVPEIDIRTVNELFILSQPAHLQKLYHRELDTSERDILRADFIRDRLN